MLPLLAEIPMAQFWKSKPEPAPEPESTLLSTLAAVLVWGAGNSLVGPGLQALAQELATDDRTRGQALSLTRLAGDAAFLAAPGGLGLLAAAAGADTALGATAASLAAANVFFAARTAPRPPGPP